MLDASVDRYCVEEIRRTTAGEQAVAVRTSTPDDELLAAELARLDRKLDAVGLRGR